MTVQVQQVVLLLLTTIGSRISFALILRLKSEDVLGDTICEVMTRWFRMQAEPDHHFVVWIPQCPALIEVARLSVNWGCNGSLICRVPVISGLHNTCLGGSYYRVRPSLP